MARAQRRKDFIRHRNRRLSKVTLFTESPVHQQIKFLRTRRILRCHDLDWHIGSSYIKVLREIHRMKFELMDEGLVRLHRIKPSYGFTVSEKTPRR